MLIPQRALWLSATVLNTVGFFFFNAVCCLADHHKSPPWDANTPLNQVLLKLGAETPAHALDGSPDPADVERGRQIVTAREATGPNGEKPGPVSKVFTCTDCHNTVREDPDITSFDPEARLRWAEEKDLPLLQGTTFWGVVNRKTWYNGDYIKDYPSLANAQTDLAEAVQFCAEHCAQGRRLGPWEMKAVMAYLWSIELKLGALGLNQSEYDWLNEHRNNPGKFAELRRFLTNKYPTLSPATFGTPPDDPEAGYTMTRLGDPATGRQIFQRSCQHCHREGGPSDLVFRDNPRAFASMERKFKRGNLYRTIREGTHPPQQGKGAYMPQYPIQRLSDNMIEDLRAYVAAAALASASLTSNTASAQPTDGGGEPDSANKAADVVERPDEPNATASDGVTDDANASGSASTSTDSATDGGGHAQLIADVTEIFKTKCYSCHSSTSESIRSFGYMDNLKVLRESDLVDLENPEYSELYIQVQTGDMPLRSREDKEAGRDAQLLTPQEVARVREWIAAGAPDPISSDQQTADSSNSRQTAQPDVSAPVSEQPGATTREWANRTFVPHEDELSAALRDLDSIDEDDQSYIRYLTIAPLHNNMEYTDDEIDVFRNGVRKALNSLSTNPRVAKFEEIGPEGVVFRVDLRDLNWDKEIWEQIVEHYPYGFRSAQFMAVAKATHSSVGFVRADWLVAVATRPPLYHHILDIPKTTQELEMQLKVDVNENMRKGEAQRSGFTDSGISFGNRMAERHEIGAYRGSYWKSYDFAGSGDKHRLHENPLGPKEAHLGSGKHVFDHDGGEMIWNLPNGFQAYMLADAIGKRLDGPAPTHIVADRDGFTLEGEISNGLSCIMCHNNGMKNMPPDEVRAVAHSPRFSPEDQKLIKELYVPDEEMKAALKEDTDTFKRALDEAGIEQKGMKEPVGELVRAFERIVTLRQAAADLGLEHDKFQAELDGQPSLFDLKAQFAGRGVPRESFEHRVPEVAAFLDLGKVEPGKKLHIVQHEREQRNHSARLSRNPIHVTLETDKHVYHSGDRLVARVKASEDVYARLYYRDAHGDLTLLYPNRFNPGGRIPGHKEVAIPAPGDQDTFDIEITGPPFGEETLAVVVSDQPFEDDADVRSELKSKGFQTHGKGSIEDLVTKAARVVIRDGSGKDLKARIGIARLKLVTKP